MAAQSLPLETLLQIFSLFSGSIAPYASVCRSWQRAVEKITFADLFVNSSNLHSFDRIVRSSDFDRCKHIRTIWFKVVLPKYSVTARGSYENHSDRKRNNMVFTQAISSLFKILSSWPKGCCHSTHLELYARSPSDWRASEDWHQRRIRQQTAHGFPEKDLLDKRYQSSYLEITEEGIGSAVDCVTSFKVSGCAEFRYIAPKAVSQIVSCLPKLQNLHAILFDNEPHDELLRDRVRDEFTAVGWPQSIRCLDLLYPGPTPKDESLAPPKRSGPGKDLLSLVLHKFSQQLESIRLSSIMIGPELFWPADTSKLTPNWPNLTIFDLRYQPATSFGTWLFEHDPAWDDKVDDPGSSSDSEELPSRFRTLPNKHLIKLYIAAAHAARNMPRLKSMRFEAEIRRCWIKEPNPEPVHSFEYNAISGQAIWTSSSEFHIEPELRIAWDAVAKSHGHVGVNVEVQCV